MGYTGRCNCGAVTLAIAGEPLATRQCWCRQCQRLATGGPTHNAMFKVADVTLTGATAQSSWHAASGNTLTFHFCPSCGTQIYGQSSARMHLMTVRLGVIDQPHGLAPAAIIWTSEAPDWAVFDPALERYEGQPTVPPPRT